MVSRKRRREQVAEREETSATITRRRASNGGSVEPPSLEKLLGGPPPPLLRGRPRDANNVLREFNTAKSFSELLALCGEYERVMDRGRPSSMHLARSFGI